MRCLTHEEAKKVLNDCHAGDFGGHLSGYATAQNILCVGYFWPTIFRDCILAVRSCHACLFFTIKSANCQCQCILSSLCDHFQNGVLTLGPVTLICPGGMVILLSQSTT